MQSCRIGWKSGALITRISRKRNEFSFFSIVLTILQLLITLESLIQVGFSAKFTSSNEHFDQIEYWKCHMLDFGLTSLDRITWFRHSLSTLLKDLSRLVILPFFKQEPYLQSQWHQMYRWHCCLIHQRTGRLNLCDQLWRTVWSMGSWSQGYNTRIVWGRWLQEGNFGNGRAQVGRFCHIFIAG